MLVAVIGGFLLAIFRGRTSMIRMLGIVALLSGLAYLVTPLTAAGPEGDPTAFTTNLRYASPALALGALLLGVDSGLLKPRVQPWLLGSLIVLLLVQAVPVWDLHGHLWTRHFLLGAVGLAFFLIVVPVGLVLARQRGASAAMVAAGAVLALALVVAIGWPKSDDYVKDRYQASTAPHDFPVGMKAALAWFNRAQPHDSRIAVVGGRPGFKQYVFYGDDLSNHVQYVAKHGPHGAYLPIASEASQHLQRGPAFVAQCREWVQALNDGGYRYAVIGPDQRTQSVAPVEALWTAAAGGTGSKPTTTSRSSGSIVRLTRRPAPRGRPSRPPPLRELRRLPLRGHRPRGGRDSDGARGGSAARSSTAWLGEGHPPGSPRQSSASRCSRSCSSCWAPSASSSPPS